MPETTEPRSPGKRRTEEAGARRPAPASLFPHPADLCPHFGPCGGCSRLDRPYGEQLARKRARVEAALRAALPDEPFEVAPTLPDPRPYHYRNKAIYPFRSRGRGRVVAGFFRRGSHAVVDVRRCDIQDPALTQIANRLRVAVATAGVPIYDERTGEGMLRHLFLRCGAGTGEAMVAFVTSAGLFPAGPSLARAAIEAGAGLRTRSGRRVRVASVLRNINPGPGNAVLGRRTVPLAGRPHIFDRLGALRLRVSLASFLQVNPPMALRTYDLVLRLAGERARGRAVDAYSGVGSLALLLARYAPEVVGIEESPIATADAIANARENGLGNVRFVEGRVEERLGEVEGEVDLLVLDPPRAGCAPRALEAASRLRPAAIVYVSCNPATLARDLARLVADYAVSAVRPVDLFPQTEHVEVVALLEPRRW